MSDVARLRTHRSSEELTFSWCPSVRRQIQCLRSVRYSTTKAVLGATPSEFGAFRLNLKAYRPPAMAGETKLGHALSAGRATSAGSPQRIALRSADGGDDLAVAVVAWIRAVASLRGHDNEVLDIAELG